MTTASKTMHDWFFMRPGFTSFRLTPESDSRFIFGKRDRTERDKLLDAIEEASFGMQGHKTVLYGDYGIGKTHLCHNIISEIRRRELPFEPAYFKCPAFKKKEPFSTLFRGMLSAHPTATIREAASKYQLLVNSGETPDLAEVTQSEEIGLVMSQSLISPSDSTVRQAIQWLGGEAVAKSVLPDTVRPKLKDSGDYGSVMRGIGRMFSKACGRIPLYMVDEGERLQNVADPDTYWQWLSALRELTEILDVGLVFTIGAVSRDDLPVILTQPEIIRRIGVVNYIERFNLAKEEVRTFVLEQLQTTIRKGEVPSSQRDIVSPDMADAQIPAELQEIVGTDADALACYPFEPDAFEEFLVQVSTGEMSNKPSDAQIRLDKAATRAMRRDERTISASVVDELMGQGF